MMTYIIAQDLEESCAELNEDSTARLAYSFLTCHLQQHKRKIHICHDDASIERSALYIPTFIHLHFTRVCNVLAFKLFSLLAGTKYLNDLKKCCVVEKPANVRTE